MYGYHDLEKAGAELRRRARSTNQRLTLVLSGSPDWSLSAARSVLATLARLDVVWLSDRPLPFTHQPLRAGMELLGREIDVLALDAHSGFDPDSFGAAIGSIRGGGLLLILTPSLEDWPSLLDPQAKRIAVHPFSAQQVSGRFLARFCRVLDASAGVTIARQGVAIPFFDATTPSPPAVGLQNEHLGTSEQRHAVEAILATVSGRARRPLVLTSDRGRGKTSALGMATARLLADNNRVILVTAPRRAAVEPLFRHASRLLPEADMHKNRIDLGWSRLEFLPPDLLCRTRQDADLLLVDEAAGIPAPLLERLLSTYGRVVFATTVHGYEGTGRGFEVRFRRHLDRITPGWKELRLETPIRYAKGDPLEAFATHALLLDAEPVQNALITDALPDGCRFEHLDRETLSQDESALSEVFGLLVLAHYQTRPMDLRHLLDGPNVEVHVLRHADHVVATALVAIEGGFDPDLSREIFDGHRRPRGHLLPQTLSAHAGLADAPGLGFARIVRIAVHPAVQGRGLGKRLVEEISANARGSGLDLIGSSFGATTDLLDFWLHCGFAPVHMGTSRNAASGVNAAVVLLALTPAGIQLKAMASRRLGERLPVLLAGPLRDLEPAASARLLANAPSHSPVPDPSEWPEIRAFAFAHRPYETVIPPLAKLLAARLGADLAAGLLDKTERDVLIAKVLQNRDWSEVSELVGVTGRTGVVDRLRRATAKLFVRYAPVV